MRDDLDDFRIGNASEVAAFLWQLQSASAPVVLAAPDGASLTARLWSLDANTGSLHFGVDESAPQLAALLAAEQVVAISHLDRVQLQFNLDELVLVRSAQTSSLRTNWPECMLRLQRRENFRVTPSTRGAPRVELRHPAMPDMTLSLRLLDVSIGGCALLLPHDVPELEPGSLIKAVRAQLDVDSSFDGALQLHHISHFDGAHAPRRVGCSWHELAPAAERVLQRYILQVQKRQRLLAQRPVMA